MVDRSPAKGLLLEMVKGLARNRSLQATPAELPPGQSLGQALPRDSLLEAEQVPVLAPVAAVSEVVWVFQV